jgi:hypothetical protein
MLPQPLPGPQGRPVLHVQVGDARRRRVVNGPAQRAIAAGRGEPAPARVVVRVEAAEHPARPAAQQLVLRHAGELGEGPVGAQHTPVAIKCAHEDGCVLVNGRELDMVVLDPQPGCPVLGRVFEHRGHQALPRRAYEAVEALSAGGRAQLEPGLRIGAHRPDEQSEPQAQVFRRQGLARPAADHRRAIQVKDLTIPGVGGDDDEIDRHAVRVADQLVQGRPASSLGH